MVVFVTMLIIFLLADFLSLSFEISLSGRETCFNKQEVVRALYICISAKAILVSPLWDWIMNLYLILDTWIQHC